MIRKASLSDIPAVCRLYDRIHTAEENGTLSIGWVRGVYPVEETAACAFRDGSLFVEENQDGVIIGAAIINGIQLPEYRTDTWLYPVPDEKVTVLHTLVISPESGGHGYGKTFVKFYENYALSIGRPYLRLDTQEKNVLARRMYHALGYREADIVPCDFHGIKSVRLVLLEKNLTLLHS